MCCSCYGHVFCVACHQPDTAPAPAHSHHCPHCGNTSALGGSWFVSVWQMRFDILRAAKISATRPSCNEEASGNVGMTLQSCQRNRAL